jgi:hypothetical protein
MHSENLGVEPTPSYRDWVRRGDLDRALAAAVGDDAVVALEGICLDEVAPVDIWGRGLLVYSSV